jgi:hypothetical protein
MLLKRQLALSIRAPCPLLVYVRRACLRTYATHALKEAVSALAAAPFAHLALCSIYIYRLRVGAYLRTYATHALKEAVERRDEKAL